MIRPGGEHDTPFLRDMLRHAFYWRTPVGEEEPPLTRYVESWGRPGDTAVIAIDDFQPVGAAWYRLFRRDRPGFGFVDEETPELAIAVVPSRRGRGFGEELLQALLDHAREEGFKAISLSVDKANPAVGLYERQGFSRLREDDGAVVMRADL
ncbi:MAG: GNAT family N-acetyltransferase [Actinomycetota bacterium]|nr:GNAT family N-acetyltransferase [Actinomycetota bacterium]